MPGLMRSPNMDGFRKFPEAVPVPTTAGDLYSGGAPTLKQHVANGGAVNLNTLVGYMPDYRGVTNPDGSLMNGFRYNPNTVDYGGLQSYDAYKNFALSKGPSDFYKDNAKLVDLNAGRSLDAMRQENARGLASGMTNLATSGGLDSGARERMGSSANRARLDASQNIYAGANAQKAGLAAQDTQMRLGALSNLTGMDTQRQNLNTQILNNGQLANLQTAIGDIRGQNAYDLEGWGRVGDLYGSEQSAQAMMAAANKENPGIFGMGGFMGTGVGGSRGAFGTGIFGDRLVDTSHWGIG